MAWDVTVADTYAESHLAATTLAAGAAADKAAANKEMKYSALASTHIFFPVAFETSGVMNRLAVDLVSEIGRRISSVTEDTRETMFLFQRLSVALQRGNAVSFQATFANSEMRSPMQSYTLFTIFHTFTFGNLVLGV